MKWEQITKDQRDTLLELYQKDSSSIVAVAGKLEMNAQTLQRRLREHRECVTAEQIDRVFPPSPARVYDDFLRIKTDNAIIISDIELPDHSDLMLELALMVGVKNDIKNLVIAGDLLATDQSGLATHNRAWMPRTNINYEVTRNIGSKVLNGYSRWFDQIDVISGNHDEHLNWKTDGEVWIGMLYNNPKVNFSRYRFMFADTSRGPVKIVHPENFSSNPVTLGQQMYDVEPEKCHIVLAHTHLAQNGFSKDGTHEIHALGTMRDPMRTQYKAIGANKHHQWVNQFLMIRDGYFYSLPLRGTNWKEVLGNLYPRSLLGTQVA